MDLSTISGLQNISRWGPRRLEAGSTDRSDTPEGCERAFAVGEGEVLVVENALYSMAAHFSHSICKLL